jgi:hypothetical protein
MTNPTAVILIADPCAPLASGGSAFTGTPPATLQLYLANAQTALTTLLTGGKPVTVSYGEGSGQKSVTYQRANEAALRQHILELRQLLGIGGRRRAIGVRT